jgi:hypothetical protein
VSNGSCVDSGALDLKPLQAREGKEVFDKLLKAVSGGNDAPRIAATSAPELLGEVLQEDLSEAFNTPQGGPKIVADAVRESFHRLLICAPFRVVARDLCEANKFARVIVYRVYDDVRPEPAAVLPHTPSLHVDAAFLARDL